VPEKVSNEEVMNVSVLPREVARIFGVPEALAAEFLRNMNRETADVPEGFFAHFLSQIPAPKYFQIPLKPSEPPTTNWEGKPFPEEQARKWRAEYEEELKQYEETLARLGRTTALNDELHINQGDYMLNETGSIVGRFPKGEFGYVKPNKSRPNIVYKFIAINAKPSVAEARAFFSEALVNLIVQLDPRATDHVMKLYNVYATPGYHGTQIILKLEALGYSPEILFSYGFGDDLEKNKKIALTTYGPLLETVQYLRATYDFSHGDMHANNILLPKSLDIDAIDTSLLQAKMIDFGFSGVRVGGMTFGQPYSESKEDFEKELLPFLYHKFRSKFPADFVAGLQAQKVKTEAEALAFEQFIIDQYKGMSSAAAGAGAGEGMAGGKRRYRKSRKHLKKKRSTRRCHHKSKA
jgi:hypothetical protein